MNRLGKSHFYDSKMTQVGTLTHAVASFFFAISRTAALIASSARTEQWSFTGGRDNS